MHFDISHHIVIDSLYMFTCKGDPKPVVSRPLKREEMEMKHDRNLKCQGANKVSEIMLSSNEQT